MLVFGKGVGSCLGRKLAMMELKYTVAAMVRRYKVTIGSSTTDEDMEMTCHFVALPKGHKCTLKISRAD